LHNRPKSGPRDLVLVLRVRQVADFEPVAAFTIAAAFIKNDLKVRDCDGNVAADTFNTASTGRRPNRASGWPRTRGGKYG